MNVFISINEVTTWDDNYKNYSPASIDFTDFLSTLDSEKKYEWIKAKQIIEKEIANYLSIKKDALDILREVEEG